MAHGVMRKNCYIHVCTYCSVSLAYYDANEEIRRPIMCKHGKLPVVGN